jgi:hypothetical protein
MSCAPRGSLRRQNYRKLKVDQGSISKLERRTDMYIGTLRRYIEAMGGSLQIRAVFPDGEVQLKQFQDAH